MAPKRSSVFLRLYNFFVILDPILNSKMQKSLLLQFVPPQIRNALDYSVDCRIPLTRKNQRFSTWWWPRAISVHVHYRARTARETFYLHGRIEKVSAIKFIIFAAE